MSVTVNTSPTNGVSYGNRHTITAAEVADGTIIFDFQNSINLVAVVMLTTSVGVVEVTDGMIVTYPAVGQIQIAEGTGNASWSAGDILHIIANKRRTD